MFLTKVCGGKPFGTVQKIHEVKKGISKLRGIKSKSKVIMLTLLLKKSTDNINQTESEKYGYTPNYIKKIVIEQKLQDCI